MLNSVFPLCLHFFDYVGIPIGPKAPEIVTAFIEMVPSDSVKVYFPISQSLTFVHAV